MEVEIATENFVGTLAAEHHLDTHRLDDSCQQVHRRRGADGSDIVGFDEIDDVTNSIQSILNGVVDFVVNGADMVGHHLGLGQVGGSLQTDGKGVQTRPISFGLRIVLDAML